MDPIGWTKSRPFSDGAAADQDSGRRPPSIPDLHRRSGSVPESPILLASETIVRQSAVSSKEKKIHSGK